MRLKRYENQNEFLKNIYKNNRNWRFIFIVLIMIGTFVGGVIFGTVAGDYIVPSENPIKIYVLNILYSLGIYPGNGLQDFIDEKYNIPKNYIGGMLTNPECISINIKNNDFQKLVYKREVALTLGQLITSDDDYVSAVIHHNNINIDVDLRLKGDWVDHLDGEKWSFRVKTKGDSTLFGMKIFSIQDPFTRNFIGEWIFHKALSREGIISLRYDFIDVTINGKHKGIYAIEEHFDKRLIEYNKRKEGPIIRFNDNLYFANALKGNNIFMDESYIQSDIDSFQSSKLIEDESLFKDFIIAHNLLESFRNGHLKTSEVFDVKTLTTKMAISDVLGAQHGDAFINNRFYYNPVTSKLEPIGFDGHAGQEITYIIYESDDMYYKTIFDDKYITEMYISELERLSQTKYLDNLFYDISDEMKTNISIIHRDVPFYRFHKEYLYNNQEYIQNKLNPVKGFHAYLYSYENDSIVLELGNLQIFPIEVLDISHYDNQTFKNVGKNKILSGRNSTAMVTYEKFEFLLPESDILINENYELKVNYRILGHSCLREEEVFPWPAPSKDFITFDFIRQEINMNYSFIEINENDKTIRILPGLIEIERDIVFPPGYKVIYSENGFTQIDLKNGSSILSYSPIYINGSNENLFVITSSDFSGEGLVVINAGDESILQWVEINNQSPPSKNGWNLTGSITFYESPVRFENCYLSENRKGDDLVNIIRSNFIINNTIFKDSLSDALDVDFSDGDIYNSSFYYSGNDAIDFSGSIVNISFVNIKEAGDKGVSVGESSIVNIENMKIEKCYIAIASKDYSLLNIKDVNISSCDMGLVAYQKKSEFGKADIYAYSINMYNVSELYIIEVDSVLGIDGNIIIGNKENVYNLVG